MSGIEYIAGDLSKHPQCPHGPTLLFSRSINDKNDKRSFYACSACRDRKYCSFFLWENETDQISASRKKIWKMEREKYSQNFNHRKLFIQLNEIQPLNEKLRIYCNKCDSWVLRSNKDEHTDHELTTGVSNNDLSYPSTFLKPLSNTKKEAQYLFSKSAVTSILNILHDLEIKNVLCIGAPRIHENIQMEHPNMTSLLLDFDSRYHNFYGPLQFCWYNLFNNHFFMSSAKSVYSDYLQTNKGKGLAIIIDPPFGGRIEPIAQTLKQIEKQYQRVNDLTDSLPVFLFFPYFMEPQILISLPDYKMVDFKVDYDNHALFKNASKGRKFGSPVRIFTNVPLSDINLSKEEGYKFCKLCNHWVYKENIHCKICKSCTSKDGRTYIHCNKCTRCVKPTWVHCEKCERCGQPDHKCGDYEFSLSCFHCKEQGHKKNNCPKVDHEQLKRKRNEKAKKKQKCS